ncbi:hypothetical protein, partial [Streptomyces violaceorubidus]|uniref:hypothetical protein n=1 Tax=Streptomyces violaceorubidus TaxID=284042 RepID=UPI0012FF32D3
MFAILVPGAHGDDAEQAVTAGPGHVVRDAAVHGDDAVSKDVPWSAQDTELARGAGRAAGEGDGASHDGLGAPEVSATKRAAALDAGAVRSFQRLWAKAPVDTASMSPAHRAVRRAHALLGGTPARAGAVIERFTVHAGDFTALSEADRHVAAVAYVLMRGTTE